MATLTLPCDLFEEIVEIGFDFGSSLTKVAYITPSKNHKFWEVRMLKFPETELETVLQFLGGVQARPQAKTMTTGIWAPRFKDQIQKSLGTDFKKLARALPKHEMVHPLFEDTIREVESKLQQATKAALPVSDSGSKVRLPWCEPGLPDDWYRWTRVHVDDHIPYVQADPDLYPCLLVMVGSACATFKIESDGSASVAVATYRSGKTLQSMAKLFLGVKDFEEMIQLIAAGTNANVDLLQSDPDPDKTGEGLAFAGGAGTMGTDDSLVYGYGRALDKEMGSFRREDVMKTILCHVIGDVARIAAYKAQAEGIKRVFFCGNTVSHPLIRQEMTKCLAYQKKTMPKTCVEFNFLLHGGHYGVLGALLSHSNTTC